MTKIINKTVLLLLFLTSSVAGIAQQNSEKILIDEVVAVVGSNIVLYSDIENEYFQYLMQGSTKGPGLKCQILEEVMFQKLLLTQAEIDSVTVTDKQVESELDRRMRYFIDQIGSKEKLEEYFKKTVLQIKEEMRSKIRDYLLIQNVQAKLTQNVKITPTEVTEFFNAISPDSLPLVGSQIEVAQIVKKAVISQDEVNMVKEKLNGLRERVLKGEDFATLANLYSEDPGSMTKGGELGFVGRGELFTEFEAAAFSLKPGEVSPIVKTQKGYHIIQMIERRGEYINVRHILMIPKASLTDMIKSKKEIDRIAEIIKKDSLSFERAAALYSDDPTKVNGGLLTNQYSGDSKFSPEEIDPNMFFVIEKMKVGEISAPMVYTNEDGQQAYRMLKLKSRTEPHKANLKDDYPQIQNIAVQVKQNQAISDWINEKTQNTFISISDNYKDCNYKYTWLRNDKQ
ncbi:MAG TPA: peptidylprolyl isomerase [Bacteroidales bacterium]|nr:peptidylprolyl isomerase [Bacteroidales bacterium]HPB24279.1 peptidylprolyl isomerase [Bacteroidales bacterium]HQN14874.1 peptidylprolyl isomerase [Bacteroidales bacterium]HQP14344.1 peptidylprolyl isomerase [Bacteroidales bacterium]